MPLSSLIESILFYLAEPVTVGKLSAITKRSREEISAALDELDKRLEHGGIRLVRNRDEVTLATAPEASALIEQMTKEELSKDLSKAALETLAIVLYKGPVTRAEIDYIRGVNSTFILRNLQIRGLVEKVENPSDQRSFLYRATFQLLEMMGATDVAALPRREEVMATLASFVKEKETEKTETDNEASVPEAAAPNTTGDDEEEEFAAVLEEDTAGESFDDEALRERAASESVNESAPADAASTEEERPS